MMLSSMLVGLNGTKFSQAAAQHAILLARKFNARLIGVSVIDIASIHAPEPVPLGATGFKERRDAALVEALRKERADLCQNFQAECQAAGVDVRTLNVEGDPVEVLAAESQRVDLVVVGKKHLPTDDPGPSSFTLQSLLHRVPRPVLCVPDLPRSGNDVVIAYDGSPEAAKVLQLFVHCNLAGDHRLQLLTVADSPEPIAERGLEFLAAHGLSAEVHYGSGNPAQCILDLTKKLNASMIVMGAYGQGPIREWIFGSVTRTVLQETPVPVFLYH